MIIKKLIIAPYKNLKTLKLKNSYFLGEWCNRYEKYKNFKTHRYHWNNIKKVNTDQEKINKYYEVLLKNLSTNLNKIHKVKKNKRFWRILIGPWLYFYIGAFYDRWEIINSFFKDNNYKFQLPIPNKKYFYNPPLDTKEFLDNLKNDDAFNYLIFLKIFNYSYSDRILLKKNKNLFFFKSKTSVKTKKKLLIERIKDLSFNFISFLSLFVNDIFLDLNYFPKKKLLKFFIKTKQLPTFGMGLFDLEDKKKSKLDVNLRNQLISIKSNISFINFIKQNIIYNFPTIFLEDFKKNFNSKLFFYNFNKKRIYSDTNYLTNEGFKFWIAESISASGKFYASKHGSFLINKNRNNYSGNHPFKISDSYLGWTKKTAANIGYIPPVQLLKFKQLNSLPNLEKKNCFIIEPSCITYNSKCHSFPYNENYSENLSLTKIFLKNLEVDIRKEVVLRILNSSGRKYLKLDLATEFNEITICNLKTDFFSRLKNTKIAICKYMETPVTDLLFSNIPFVILVPIKSYDAHRHKKTYKLLEENNMLFHDAQKASSFVNSVWNDPGIWWNSPNVKKIRKNLKKEVAIIKDDWLSDLIKTLG